VIGAKVLLDSINLAGDRLTTMEVTFPRFVLAEFNTHRVFSRNSASSRAIPIQKIIDKVLESPVIPVWWGKNQKGMQAEVELVGEELEAAKAAWLRARDRAVESARDMLDCGVHKQLTNRILEPWLYTTVIVSSTKYNNFELLRCDLNAQPEIRVAAEEMRAARTASEPKKLSYGEWHIPAVTDEERAALSVPDLLKLATARLARVSYLTHDGVRDISEDFDMHDNRLAKNGHWSPFEHCAKAVMETDPGAGGIYRRPSNFHRTWWQYRKSFEKEAGGDMVIL
jgi:thymidylate synthase ThyX